jgi:S-adenosylmethionine:tRNA ribosyltransferase-isomerase
MSLSTELFDYPLPTAAIAQAPSDRRDGCKLMVVHRDTKQVEHRLFSDLPALVPARAAFFRNNAKVIKARLFLNRASGGEVEILLLHPSTDAHTWWCLAKPLKKIKLGETVVHDSTAVATLIQKSDSGESLWRFEGSPLAWADKLGHLPLPPYIAREKNDPREAADAVRYQTVYAQAPVAAAAPTAGLHFTSELIASLQAQGHPFYDLTLHVGLDTFRPITAANVEEHKIHTETYEVPAATAKALDNEVFKIAVGTTSLRSMEDYTRRATEVAPDKPLAASIYIYPPQEVVSAQALITNFHLPKSTLLCLVSTFLTPHSTDGIAWLKELYAEALAHDYRFYSYGDAMLIL